MSSENRKGFWTTGHLALNWDGDAMVLACEEGHLDSVKALVEGHDVEKTGMSVDEMLNREGKNSSGKLARPFDAAATALKFDIVVYLARKGAKGEKFAGTPMDARVKMLTWIL